MPAFTAATIALLTSVVGTATAVAGGIAQNNAQQDATAASKRAEDIRRQQMELENTRRQREILRKSQAARAQAIATASTRGALQSDVVPGAIGQIETNTGQALVAQAENTALSRGIFDANAEYIQAKSDAATYSAVSDFGKTLFNNSQKIGALGDTLFNSQSDWITTTKLGA